MEMKRSAYQLKAGSLANMKLISEELLAPTENEVTVEVKAIGLNFADVFVIWGLYKGTPPGIFTPGLEYTGVIQKVGSKVTKVKPGDKVLLVDDLIATGGTAEGAVKLLKEMGAEVVAACFVIDLPDLGGRKKIEALGVPVRTLIEFEGH